MLRLRGGLPCREATTVVKHCGVSAGAVHRKVIDDPDRERNQVLIKSSPSLRLKHLLVLARVWLTEHRHGWHGK